MWFFVGVVIDWSLAARAGGSFVQLQFARPEFLVPGQSWEVVTSRRLEMYWFYSGYNQGKAFWSL